MKAQEATINTRASQVDEIVKLWKTEIEMNDNTNDSNGTVKSEEELLQELLEEGQVLENEIDRENKTITIGDKIISYKTKSQLTDIYVALYNDGTLVFNNKNEFDTSKLAEGWTIENIKGKKYEMVSIAEEPWFDLSKLPKWIMNENITKIDFLNKIVPEYINFWFDNLTNLTTIENMSNLDTSNITDMSGMFFGCESLQNIDLTGLDTSNVTNMLSMFYGCASLKNIDLTELDTSKVTNMSGMFFGCESLQNIDLTGLDTSNVTNMSRMFYGCDSLQNINLTGLDTSNVTDMRSMFQDSGLKNIDLSKWNVGKVETMEYMFWQCSSLENINVSNWNTSKVTNMRSMFSKCTALTSIDVRHFNTSNVTDMGGMFSNCTALTNIDVSGFNTSKVTSMVRMFGGCTNLVKLDVSNFDITYMKTNPIKVQRMFEGVTCPVTISSEWTKEMKDESEYKEQ